MADKPGRPHQKNTAEEPADKRVRARRADIDLPGKTRKRVLLLHVVSAKVRKGMGTLRRSLFRLIRKAVLFLMAQTGSTDTPSGRPATKKRISRKRFMIYAGSGLIVVVIVLLVLFVPSKAAVHPTTESASPSPTGTPELWQAAVDGQRDSHDAAGYCANRHDAAGYIDAHA